LRRSGGASAPAGAGAAYFPAETAGPAPSVSISASSVPTRTVSPSGTRIFEIFPPIGDGTSVSTLSVEISNSGSSRSIDSPSDFSQRVMVPSTTVSPSWGIVTGVATSNLLLTWSHRVQRFAGQREHQLADALG